MTGRLAAILALALCTTLPATAQPYVCTSPGTTLHYVRRTADGGQVKWVHDMKVERVERLSDGSANLFTVSTFTKENGKPYYRRQVHAQAHVSPQGSVASDFGKTAAEYGSAAAGITMEGSGSVTVLEPDLQPGDVLPDLQAEFGLKLVRYKVRVTDRKVLRRESLTVPAGTFECIVISENKSEDGPGHHRQVTNLSWYARDTGYVRHDTFSTDGRLQTTEILQSIR